MTSLVGVSRIDEPPACVVNVYYRDYASLSTSELSVAMCSIGAAGNFPRRLAWALRDVLRSFGELLTSPLEDGKKGLRRPLPGPKGCLWLLLEGGGTLLCVLPVWICMSTWGASS